MHVLFALQVPEQQSVLTVQFAPAAAQHLPALQLSVQQSKSISQSPPSGEQSHMPPVVQTPEQQSVLVWQMLLFARQHRLCALHRTVKGAPNLEAQQSAATAHVSAESRQHAPF